MACIALFEDIADDLAGLFESISLLPMDFLIRCNWLLLFLGLHRYLLPGTRSKIRMYALQLTLILISRDDDVHLIRPENHWYSALYVQIDYTVA
jgi:hypothetical protein